MWRRTKKFPRLFWWTSHLNLFFPEYSTRYTVNSTLRFTLFSLQKKCCAITTTLTSQLTPNQRCSWCFEWNILSIPCPLRHTQLASVCSDSHGKVSERIEEYSQQRVSEARAMECREIKRQPASASSNHSVNSQILSWKLDIRSDLSCHVCVCVRMWLWLCRCI